MRLLNELQQLLNELHRKGINVRLIGTDDLAAGPRQNITATESAQIRDNKAALVDYLSSSVSANDDTHHGDDPAFMSRLQTELGEDWAEVSADPAQLEAAAHSFRSDECRRLGKRPAHYTATAICRGCGPVPIFEGTTGHVLGCPWCSNRANGLPIPRPLLPWAALPESFRICRRLNAAGQDVQCVDMLARRLFQHHHDDLVRSAGKDWARISSDPDRLAALMFAEARRLINEAGMVPDCDKDQDLV